LADEDADRDEASGDEDDVFDEDNIEIKIKNCLTLSRPTQVSNPLENGSPPNGDENSNSGKENGSSGNVDLPASKSSTAEVKEEKQVPIRQ
jgi:hypothetical protein